MIENSKLAQRTQKKYEEIEETESLGQAGNIKNGPYAKDPCDTEKDPTVSNSSMFLT